MRDTLKLLLLWLLLIPFIFTSCDNQEKFVKVKWNESADPVFPPPNRKTMIKDLLTNYQIVGLKCSQLTDTLGDPDFKEDFSFGYRIEENYGNDIDPVYSKDLVFYFSTDSTITSYEVKEWKK